jgi:hypothetical protein
MNDQVLALAVGPDGTLYAGGLFTTAGGGAANYIAKWNGTAWSALGTGMGAAVYALAVGPDGTLYAGGVFTTAGGGAANYIAKWNGTAWSALGTGVNSAVYALSVGPDGTAYAGGQFTSAGGISLPDGIAQWNGSTWMPIGANLPGTAIAYAMKPLANGNLFIGFTFSISNVTITEANVTATNDGTARAYPTLIIKGPTSGTSRIYQMRNVTTGRAIYLNYTINAGETATLRFEPDNLSFTSDFQGNIANKIMPGSNEADFFLQPGANTIAFYSANSTVTATLRWRPAFTALQGLTH